MFYCIVIKPVVTGFDLVFNHAFYNYCYEHLCLFLMGDGFQRLI